MSAEAAAPAPVVVKEYTGDQSAVQGDFEADAAKMAANGYFPTTQEWRPGQYGCGSFIIALLLCFILIGFLIFVYMLIVKPDGMLTVTYEYRGAAQPASAEKACPMCAENVKAAAVICRFCGHKFQEPRPSQESSE